jgi:hypothetical protein
MARLEKVLKKETRVVRFVMEAAKKIRRDCGDHVIRSSSGVLRILHVMEGIVECRVEWPGSSADEATRPSRKLEN